MYKVLTFFNLYFYQHHHELASLNHEAPSKKLYEQKFNNYELYLVLPTMVAEIFFLGTCFHLPLIIQLF